MSLKRLLTICCIALSVNSLNAQQETFKEQLPENVILMIGDGMGIAQMYAAYTANGQYLNIFGMPVTGIMLTYSADEYTTDSAAGGTAFACGKKTNNGSLSVDTAGKPMQTIFEYAKEKHYSTGIAVTCAITHATPAAFYAHVGKRSEYETIASHFLNKTVDVAFGGGRKYFVKRKDKRNLIELLMKDGYFYSTNIDSVDISQQKVLCLATDGDLPKISEGRNDFLPLATQKSIELLKKNRFLLMVEGSQIDWGNHLNSINYVINETVDFDKAVKVALDFAKKDGKTLVIVTADHESGGLTLINGNFKKSTVDSNFSSLNHTAVPVMVFAYGPGAEMFTGCYQNTALFDKIKMLISK